MNTFVLVLKDVGLGIIYFPIWWYTRGLLRFLKGLGNSVQGFNLQIGWTIWVKNIFVPMYGQNDIAGRLFSFVLRVANIIIRGFFLLLIFAVHIVILLAWLVGPFYILSLV